MNSLSPNISPNQFALPGMESQSHPLAHHVAAGVRFDMANQGGDHELTARSPSGGGLGSLAWAGTNSFGAHYPGEIQGVVRHPATPKQDYRPGLMTDMYKAGHQMNMGQDTVPLHSPTRTEAGEAWSKKVGGPRPERHDFAWRPPEGTHPFEQRNLSPPQFGPSEGQGELIPRGAGRKSFDPFGRRGGDDRPAMPSRPAGHYRRG